MVRANGQLRKTSPLFARLQELSRTAAQQFRFTLHGFDNIGLNICDVKPSTSGGYWCSPVNSKCFASTGGEGVHFSFIAEANDDRFDELPVIVTIPGAFEWPNFVVGENLFEFLCLGFYRGFFALEQLANQLEKTLLVYGSPDWKSESHDDDWVGFGSDESTDVVLTYLRESLPLKPWINVPTRFKALQEVYLSKLRIPETD